MGGGGWLVVKRKISGTKMFIHIGTCEEKM